MQELILLGRQRRNQVNIKVKTPLQSLTVIHQSQAQLDGIAKLENYIKTELNIKEVKYSTDEDKYITLYAKPNSRVLGKRLGKEFGKMMGMIKNLSSETLKDFEAKGTLELSGHSLDLEEVFVYREPLEGVDALSNRWITIDMDTKLTDELINEGLAREVINRIQRSRKDALFNVEDRIKLDIYASDKLAKVINTFSDYIKSETLTTDISFSASELATDFQFDIEKETLHLSLTKN